MADSLSESISMASYRIRERNPPDLLTLFSPRISGPAPEPPHKYGLCCSGRLDVTRTYGQGVACDAEARAEGEDRSK